jgi:hypothetical protein
MCIFSIQFAAKIGVERSTDPTNFSLANRKSENLREAQRE